MEVDQCHGGKQTGPLFTDRLSSEKNQVIRKSSGLIFKRRFTGVEITCNNKRANSTQVRS